MIPIDLSKIGWGKSFKGRKCFILVWQNIVAKQYRAELSTGKGFSLCVLNYIFISSLGNIYGVVSCHASDYLAELASEYNEDPEQFKKRVFSI